MGEVVTQTVTFEKWPAEKPAFETADDLFDCLKDFVEAGHRGQVRMPVENGQWDVTIGIGDISVVATFGQCVVTLGEATEAMTVEQYDSRFTSKKKAK